MKQSKNYEAIRFAQHQRNMIYDQVIGILERAASERGVTQAQIAQKLGCSKSYVSRLLSGPGNWTLDTVSNLLFAVDAEMRLDAVFSDAIAKENRFHPAATPPTRKAA